MQSRTTLAAKICCCSASRRPRLIRLARLEVEQASHRSASRVCLGLWQKAMAPRDNPCNRQWHRGERREECVFDGGARAAFGHEPLPTDVVTNSARPGGRRSRFSPVMGGHLGCGAVRKIGQPHRCWKRFHTRGPATMVAREENSTLRRTLLYSTRAAWRMLRAFRREGVGSTQAAPSPWDLRRLRKWSW